MAAIVAAQAGNWSATSTWTGGVVPGNGDTVTIAKAVTVDVNTTIGASNGVWVSGGNPGAIQLNSGGAITIATGIKLTVRGDFIVAGAYQVQAVGLTMNAGSTFEFDASASPNPNTTAYRHIPTGTSYMPLSAVVANGTQAQPCFIQSNAGGANGNFTANGYANWMGGLTASYTTFLRIGDAVTNCWQVAIHSPGAPLSLTHCVFDTCGLFHVVNISAATDTCLIQDVVFKNSLNANYNIDASQYATYRRVVFDRKGPAGSAVFLNAVFDTCFFQMPFFGAGNGNRWTSANNLFFHHDGSDVVMPGDLTNSVFFIDINMVNPHTVSPSFQIPGGTTMTGLIFEFTNNNGSGDATHYSGNPLNANSLFISSYNLILPNAGGDCSTDALTLTGQFNPNGTVQFEHNTFIIGSGGATYNETVACTTGTVTSFRNNIAWDTSVRGPMLLDIGHLGSSTGLTTDTVLPANADFNNSYNAAQTYPSATWFTNQGNGYAAAYSSTPGVHDKHVNPNFVDITRNTATFDSAYLGHTATTWASELGTKTFAVGDIRSNNNAIYYGGAVINFRCIQAHTKSTAGTEPGGSFSTAWRSYWEFATLNTLRNALGSSALGSPTTITDSSLGLTSADYITALRAWIMRGFQPTNVALKNAGSDGLDIGAVPMATITYGTNQDLLLMGIG